MIVVERSPLRMASFTASTSIAYTSGRLEKSMRSGSAPHRSMRIVASEPFLPGSQGDETVIRPLDPSILTALSRFAWIEHATRARRPSKRRVADAE